MIGSVVVLPLVHVAYEVAKIVARGQLQYGARVHTGRDSLSPLAHGLGHAWDSLGSPVAWLLLGVAAASLAVGLTRRRVNWTDLGLVVTALASVEMGVQTGVFPSRYYLASLVLLAVVCVRVLGRISRPRRLGWLARSRRARTDRGHLARSAHSAVGTWATYDQAGVELADTVGKLRAGGCRVEITGLDLERTAAVRALTGEIPARRSCRRAYVVVASGRPPDSALLGTCDKRPLERWRLQGGEEVQLRRCPVPSG